MDDAPQYSHRCCQCCLASRCLTFFLRSVSTSAFWLLIMICSRLDFPHCQRSALTTTRWKLETLTVASPAKWGLVWRDWKLSIPRLLSTMSQLVKILEFLASLRHIAALTISQLQPMALVRVLVLEGSHWERSYALWYRDLWGWIFQVLTVA